MNITQFDSVAGSRIEVAPDQVWDRWIALGRDRGADRPGGGDRLRLNHCVPMPVVDSIAQLNELFDVADAKDDHRRLTNRTNSVGVDFAFERRLLRPAGRPLRADHRAAVPVLGAGPVHRAPAAGPARRASKLVVFDGRVEIAPPRTLHRQGRAGGRARPLSRRLQRRPGALPGATALAHARAAGVFTPIHEAFWAAARNALGDSGRTRALIEVLLLHRRLDHGNVLAGFTGRVSVGSVSADVVAVGARKTAQHRDATAPPIESTPAGRS